MLGPRVRGSFPASAWVAACGSILTKLSATAEAYNLAMRFRQLPKIKRRVNRDGSAVWWAEWFETVTPKHRQHRSVVLGDARKLTKTDARDRLAELLERASPTSATWTVSRFVGEVWFPPRLRRWPINTRGATESLMSTHILPAFGQTRLAEIRKTDVERWLLALADRGYSRNTAGMLLMHLRSVFNEAMDNGILERNPAARIKLPTMAAEKETQPYTEAETRFLAGQPGTDGLALRLMLFCGLRPGEVLALEAGDISGRTLAVKKSLDAEGIKCPKTGKAREVSLPPVLAGELKAFAETAPHGRLFRAWGSTNQFRKTLAARYAAVIPDFSLRRCRTTFATRLQADLADVAHLLGHSTALMTLEHYRKGITARQAEAVADLERQATEGSVN